MTEWKLFDVTSHIMNGFLSSPSYSLVDLFRLQNFASLFNKVAVHTFRRQTSKNIANSEWIGLHNLLRHGQKTIEDNCVDFLTELACEQEVDSPCEGIEKSSVGESSKRVWSAMHWGLRPSGRANEPAENVWRERLKYYRLIWSVVKQVVPVESMGRRRSGAGPGCLSRRACRFASLATPDVRHRRVSELLRWRFLLKV